ncbi:MAG: PhnD/SsuA/transferrin family substrate-binding protein [Opitutae bacterium]|nr:PhnD/SsuA/transferrin family substrate-binding protein [Opitutae bacterium]
MNAGPDLRPLYRRWRALVVLVLGLLAAMHGAAAETQEDNLLPLTLNVGFIRSCFLNVNRADAESAFKVLTESIGRKHGYRVNSRTQIFDTTAEIESAVKAGAVNLIIIDSWKYLACDLGADMPPRFVTAEQGEIGKPYLILTHRKSGFATLNDLRGKGLTLLEVANTNAGKAWLDTLVRKQGDGTTPADFFGALDFADKPSAAILPVFFGKKAACLVDRFSFDLMKELNPQVGQTLRAIAISEPFVDNVVCLSDTGWETPAAKATVLNALAELHLDPAGQQILLLFKIGRLLPFAEAQLDTVKQLRALHSSITPEAGK